MMIVLKMKTILFIGYLFVSLASSSTDFITEWEIDHTSSNHKKAGFRINTFESNLDFSIDWGDGTSSSHTSSNPGVLFILTPRQVSSTYRIAVLLHNYMDASRLQTH